MMSVFMVQPSPCISVFTSKRSGTRACKRTTPTPIISKSSTADTANRTRGLRDFAGLGLVMIVTSMGGQRTERACTRLMLESMRTQPNNGTVQFNRPGPMEAVTCDCGWQPHDQFCFQTQGSEGPPLCAQDEPIGR